MVAAVPEDVSRRTGLEAARSWQSETDWARRSVGLHDARRNAS